VLVYNLVFLSTFVLSGLGMFCLVNELTGRSGMPDAPPPFRTCGGIPRRRGERSSIQAPPRS
jgi:hypothetical protein